MKYYIKSAKGYWRTQGHGYTQNQSEAYAFTLDQMLQFAQSGRLHAPQTVLNTLKGVLTTLCYAKSLNYKTITPKTPPKTPKAVWGFFVPL